LCLLLAQPTTVKARRRTRSGEGVLVIQARDALVGALSRTTVVGIRSF